MANRKQSNKKAVDESVRSAKEASTASVTGKKPAAKKAAAPKKPVRKVATVGGFTETSDQRLKKVAPTKRAKKAQEAPGAGGNEFAPARKARVVRIVTAAKEAKERTQRGVVTKPVKDETGKGRNRPARVFRASEGVPLAPGVKVANPTPTWARTQAGRAMMPGAMKTVIDTEDKNNPTGIKQVVNSIAPSLKKAPKKRTPKPTPVLDEKTFKETMAKRAAKARKSK